MMLGHDLGFLLVIPALCSLGVITGFFVCIGRALKKFNRLDTNVRGKLLLLEYYMAAVRRLSKEDMLLFSKLPEEEIRGLNMIHDYDERIRAIRKKIRP
jgi:hypothetical protein